MPIIFVGIAGAGGDCAKAMATQENVTIKSKKILVKNFIIYFSFEYEVVILNTKDVELCIEPNSGFVKPNYLYFGFYAKVNVYAGSTEIFT